MLIKRDGAGAGQKLMRLPAAREGDSNHMRTDILTQGREEDMIIPLRTRRPVFTPSVFLLSVLDFVLIEDII